MEASDSDRPRLEPESNDDSAEKAQRDHPSVRMPLVDWREVRILWCSTCIRVLQLVLVWIVNHCNNIAAGVILACSFVFATLWGEIRGGRSMVVHHSWEMTAGCSMVFHPSWEMTAGPSCFVSKSIRVDGDVMQDPHIWYFDTCSSYSMTGDLNLLLGVHPALLVTVSSATGHTMSSYLCGRVSGTVNLSGVRYFPGAPNLISVGHLRRLGCTATIDEGCTITNRYGRVIGKGRVLDNNMAVLDMLGGYSLGSCSHCTWPWSHIF